MADNPLRAFEDKLAKANIYGQWTGEKLFQNTESAACWPRLAR
jgi:hypothetical protein